MADRLYTFCYPLITPFFEGTPNIKCRKLWMSSSQKSTCVLLYVLLDKKRFASLEHFVFLVFRDFASVYTELNCSEIESFDSKGCKSVNDSNHIGIPVEYSVFHKLDSKLTLRDIVLFFKFSVHEFIDQNSFIFRTLIRYCDCYLKVQEYILCILDILEKC